MNVADENSNGKYDLSRHGVIEAHAGTGKTYTIVQLVMQFLRENRNRDLSIANVMLVTYTEKAAGELLDRIRKELDDGIERGGRAGEDISYLESSRNRLNECLIGTIHGICLRLLRTYPFESGMSFDVSVVNDEDGLDDALQEVWRRGLWKADGMADGLLHEILSNVPIDSHLSKAKKLASALLNDNAVLEPVGIEHQLEVKEPGVCEAAFQARWAMAAVALWKERKRSEGLISYQDMLTRMAKAVRNETFRSTLRRKIRLGVIDEFQDTSSTQWSVFNDLFLKNSAKNEGNPSILFLVGDPKQSIYSFQGADVSTYLDACQELREKHGAATYSLGENWRSTPDLIDAYNLLLTSSKLNWFGESSGISYDKKKAVTAPQRAAVPSSASLFQQPLRVFHANGVKADEMRTQYAQLCARWIRRLHGQKFSLPDGNDWKERALDWGDFAIIATSRNQMSPFQREFNRLKIPWAIYKQPGVFSSRASLELQAVLQAVIVGAHCSGLWQKALYTRVFDGNEETLLKLREIYCRSSAWERFFRVLTVESGVQKRLLAAQEGEREWMDWRQLTQHSLSWVLSGKGEIPELLEHLQRLSRGETEDMDGGDANLYARASDRGRVQILTMHSSKGLQFPVVFLSASAGSNSSGCYSWIENGKLHVMSSIEKSDSQKKNTKTQKEEELRRLYYVGITRPQLFLGMCCSDKKVKSGTPRKDTDLLSQLLMEREDECKFPPLDLPEMEENEAGESSDANPVAPVHSDDDLRKLEIPGRLQRQISYSQIQQQSGICAFSLEGRLDHAEEPVEKAAEIPLKTPDSWLPPGRNSGNALHEILEGWMHPSQDLSWALNSGKLPPSMPGGESVEDVLDRYGLERQLAPLVIDLLRRMLATPLSLGNETPFRLADLAPQDRRAEVEFHRSYESDGGIPKPGQKVEGWVHGYIDLLFRHACRWHVLDWKSTQLENGESLDHSMQTHGYKLQADFYRDAVQQVISGREELGEAVYVYLRCFADPEGTDHGFWISPLPLQQMAAPAVKQWLEQQIRREKA